MGKIILIRHRETSLNQEEIVIGHIDPEITSKAKEKIKLLSKRIGNIKKIYSSDLKRAKQTANIIRENLMNKPDIEFHKNLREVDYGTLANMKKTEAKEEFPEYHINPEFKHPKGESFQEMFDRVTKFVDSIDTKEGDVLIVTHAGCIRALISYYSKKPFSQIINNQVPHDYIVSLEKNIKFAF